MPEPSARRKAGYLLLMVLNVAVDLLLPTVVLLLLAPTGMSAAVRLSVGAALVAGKAMGGAVLSEFRWRLALPAALLPAAAIVLGHYAGLGDVPSMVAGALVSGVIVAGSLLRTRAKQRLDGFAVLVLLEIVLSVVLTSISGDARFVLARLSLYLLVGGVYVLVTAFSERPLMRTVLKPVAAKGDPERADAFDRAWRRSPRFRTLYRAMTAGLGAVFVLDAGLRLVIIYGAPSADVAESSVTSQLPLIVLLAAWFALGRGLAVPRAERLLDAEQAAARPGVQG